jgi:exosome complex component CSL4
MMESVTGVSVLKPVLRYDVDAVVVPGDILGRTVTAATSGTARIQLIAGPGTYSRGGQLFASVTGRIRVTSDDSSTSNVTCMPTATVSVIPKGGFRATQQVIRQGQTVLARVVRIATQQIMVDIVANQNGLLEHTAEGCIRRDDVKSGVQSEPNAAAAVLTQSFRPGDWIVARVLSLGDARRYFLSTAEPALGVIHAVSSVSGKPMLPVSWKEMECPETGLKEARKCARPQHIPADLVQRLQAQAQIE